jgi:hypothetical protein
MAADEKRPDSLGRERMEATAGLLREIYAIVEQLQALHPGRSFKPDGHMVGAIGEAWAAWLYDLELLPQSHESHDARASDGRLVQIKATQGKAVGISSLPSHLVVLAIAGNGTPIEVFNGPGSVAWQAAGRMQKNGQRSIGVRKLVRLMDTVSAADRLPAINKVHAS